MPRPKPEVPDDTFTNNGFVRDNGEGLVVVLPKKTELSQGDKDGFAERQEEVRNNKGGPTKERKTKLAVLGLPKNIINAGHPAYKRVIKLANGYKKARQREFYLAHGYVSSGVSALLASSALALSAARFLYEIAAGTEIQPAEKGQLGMPQILKLASGLAEASQRHELAAWELCAREANIRRRNDENTSNAPWVVTVGGKEVKVGGRPRKDTETDNA